MGASSDDSGASQKTKISWQHIIISVCVAAVVTPLAVALTDMVDSFNTPLYSATITADRPLTRRPETDLRRQISQPQPAAGTTLSPVFKLTVGVASHSRRKGARLAPGTSVKVSYSHLRLPMATGHVPDVRVGPRESRALPSVVASGRDVAVPGFLMDSLAEEMRSGQAMFEVELIESDGYGWRDVAKGWGV
ncbi:LOW QUALITY PROTEIN: hypothetical protein SORBI_3004G217300, partial [Sorghum bicolor]